MPPAVPGPSAEGQELWVDAYAAPGGDGSRERPLKRLPSALPEGAAVHLSSGLYAGPLLLPRGARLEGHGAAVVTAEGDGVAVEVTDGVLVNVSVQGGAVGVRARGKARLEKVHASGHRRAGVVVEAGAEVVLVAGDFEGAVGDAVGVEVAGGALRVEGATFRTAWRRAVAATGGRVELLDVKVEGPATALHAVDAVTRVERVAVAGGRGPAFFLARGRAALLGVSVTGHEYAVLAKDSAELTVDGLSSRGALLAGVAVDGGKAALSRIEVAQSGSLGAVQLLGATVELDGLTVRGAAANGVLVRLGTARLRGVDIEGVREEDGLLGDGVHVRDAKVHLDDVAVRDAAGSAVWVGAVAQVTLGRLTAERTGYGALVVDRRAEVHAREVVSTASRVSAVSVTDGARLTLDRLVVTGGVDVPVWAECAQGVSVRVGQIVSPTPQRPAACIERMPAR